MTIANDLYQRVVVPIENEVTLQGDGAFIVNIPEGATKAIIESTNLCGAERLLLAGSREPQKDGYELLLPSIKPDSFRVATTNVATLFCGIRRDDRIVLPIGAHAVDLHSTGTFIDPLATGAYFVLAAPDYLEDPFFTARGSFPAFEVFGIPYAMSNPPYFPGSTDMVTLLAWLNDNREMDLGAGMPTIGQLLDGTAENYVSIGLLFVQTSTAFDNTVTTGLEGFEDMRDQVASAGNSYLFQPLLDASFSADTLYGRVTNIGDARAVEVDPKLNLVGVDPNLAINKQMRFEVDVADIKRLLVFNTYASSSPSAPLFCWQARGIFAQEGYTSHTDLDALRGTSPGLADPEARIPNIFTSITFQ